jgi:hypothetical protein
MLLAPPLAGAALGLLVSIRRRRPGSAALVGIVAGTAAAWLGVAVYRLVMEQIIGGRDIGIFAVIVLGCFFLCTAPLAWLVGGSQAADGQVSVDAGPRVTMLGCGFVMACSFVTLLGVWIYAAACEPSAFIPLGVEVKYTGIAFILSGTATLAVGLAWIRRHRRRD